MEALATHACGAANSKLKLALVPRLWPWQLQTGDVSRECALGRQRGNFNLLLQTGQTRRLGYLYCVA